MWYAPVGGSVMTQQSRKTTENHSPSGSKTMGVTDAKLADNDTMTVQIQTVDGSIHMKENGCSCCGNTDVKIGVNGVAYEKNAFGTYERHTCDEGI